MDKAENEKCPVCGRPLYAGRPECIYCGYERPIDNNLKKKMKQRLVSKTLGREDEFDPDLDDDTSTIIQIKNCPTCNRTLSPGAKFCTACGTPVGQELPEPVSINEKYGQIAGRTDERIPDVIPMEESGAAATGPAPEPAVPVPKQTAVLWACALLFFVFTQVFAFGQTPNPQYRTGVTTGIVVSLPAVLWYFYMLIMTFMILIVFDIELPLPDRFKNLTALMGIEILPALIISSDIFWSLPRLAILIVLFIASAVAVARLTVNIDEKKFFNACALFSAALLMLIITPLIKTTILSDTGANPLHNKGFYSHLILNMLVLAGSLNYIFKLPSADPKSDARDGLEQQSG